MTRGFTEYDTRHYPTVDVVTGYNAWSHTYAQTVHDEFDLLRLLDDAWIAHRPGMARYRHPPVSFVIVWQTYCPATG